MTAKRRGLTKPKATMVAIELDRDRTLQAAEVLRARLIARASWHRDVERALHTFEKFCMLGAARSLEWRVHMTAHYQRMVDEAVGRAPDGVEGWIKAYSTRVAAARAMVSLQTGHKA